MIADVPPKLWTPPAIVRGVLSPWQIEAHRKLAELGVPRQVRRAVVAEIEKLRGEAHRVIRPAIDDLSKYSRVNLAMPGLLHGAMLATYSPPPVSSAYVAESHAQVTPNTTVAATISLGTADAARQIIVLISAITNDNGTGTISSCTVAGNSTSIAVQKTGSAAQSSSYFNITGIAILNLATGTSGSVSVTFSKQVITYGYAVIRALNIKSLTPTATGNSNANPLSLGLNVSAGGMACGVALAGLSSGWTWSGLTERVDADQNGSGNFYSGASNDFAAAVTPQAVTATGGSVNQSAGCSASFR